jgi:hypothetical protein
MSSQIISAVVWSAVTVSLASITASLRQLTLDLGGFQMEECGNVWTRRNRVDNL